MTEGALDLLDEQLKCSVCLDQYTNPRTLPCHHSFCLRCLEMIPVEIEVLSTLNIIIAIKLTVVYLHCIT